MRNDDVANNSRLTDLCLLRKRVRRSWRARALAPSLFYALRPLREQAPIGRSAQAPHRAVSPRSRSQYTPPPKGNDVRLEPLESVWTFPNPGAVASWASVPGPQSGGFSAADQLLPTAQSLVPAVCSVGDLEGRSEGLKTSVSRRGLGAGGQFLSF